MLLSELILDTQGGHIRSSEGKKCGQEVVSNGWDLRVDQRWGDNERALVAPGRPGDPKEEVLSNSPL